MKEEYLDPDYLPEMLPHREGEINEVFENLKPLVSGKRPTNVFMHGPAGIGKTAVARFIQREFRNEDVTTIYINGWYQRTEVAVLAEALRQLSYPVPRKGRSVDELVEDFFRNLEGEKVVFVLDEVDALAEFGVLYVLSRASLPIGVVMISNDPYAMRHLDLRTKSSLSPISIAFDKYSVEELVEILEERVKKAFKEYDPTAIKVAARLAYSHGSDVRYGLSLIRRAGRLAGKMGQKLSIEHVKKVDVKEDPKKGKRQGDLKEEHQVLLEAIKALGTGATSSNVYKKYKDLGGKGAERTFRKYVKELIELRMVGAEDLPGRGKRRLLKVLI